jgi:gluconate 2-dehydrogenase gamma chain
MDISLGNRREFLASSAALLGSGWATMHLPVLASLAAWARTAAAAQAPFTILTPAEARTMEAFAAQIVPSDGTSPGAKEAGAVWFIDRALASYFPEMKEPVKLGILELDVRARRRGKTITAFPDLSSSDQIRIMRQVEDTPFFFMGRMLTVIGVFADSRHGGNRDHVGERILGIEHKPAYQPPFGWYDAEERRKRS